MTTTLQYSGDAFPCDDLGPLNFVEHRQNGTSPPYHAADVFQ